MAFFSRRTARLAACASLLASLPAGCSSPDGPAQLVQLAPKASPAEVPAPSPPVAERRAARARCEAEHARLSALPALPGAPGYEARRAELLGRAKGEPVVFVRAPRPEAELDLRLTLLRRRMEHDAPILAISSVSEALRYAPEDARKLLLTEGYVYAESPEVATVLVDVLKLPRLFRERSIYLLRGAAVHRLDRDDKGGYRFTDGESKGEEAYLLFGDRVGVTEAELSPRLHRDLSRLVQSEAPDRVRVSRITSEGTLAELRYGALAVPAVLADDGAAWTLGCALPPEGREAEVEQARQANLARAAAVEPVREATRAMVQEKLRFDEPLEEVGQQDGSLRPLWRWSYDHGGRGYSFNGIGYPVFDSSGRPAPPQVCVDLVLDAYERASGTWYRGLEGGPERVRGGVDFEGSDLRNRRSAAEFVTFAGAHPELFDVWNPPDEERVPFYRRADFFAYLESHADRLHVGDAVVIHGTKADGKVHYHSFLIDALDPITGLPFRLVGNAGRPRFQSWEGVMRSAPARSVRHVVSPRLDWLKATMPKPHDAVAVR